MDDLRPILDPAPVGNEVKRKAWDAWHAAKTPQEFRASFDDMPLPRETKRALWDAKFKSQEAGTPKPTEGIMSRLGQDASLGWRAGEADVAHTVANVAGAIPIPAVRLFGQRAEEYAGRTAPTSREMEGHEGVLDQVVEAGASAPAQIAKYLPAAAAGKYAPLVGGAISAAGSIDKGPRAALRAGAEGAAQWYAMEKTGKIKGLLPRVAVSSAIQAVPTAIESGGDVKKTAAAAITGAAFGIPAAHERLTPAMAREALKGGIDAAAALRTDILRDFGPHHIDNPGKVSAEVLTERLAEMHLSGTRSDYALREAKKAFNGMPPEDVIEFYGSIQGGAQRQSGWRTANPKAAQFADSIRKVLDDKREEVTRDTGKLEQFYLDYFPQIWKDPDKAADFVRNFYAGKRPLKGGGTRFRERKIPTIADGLAGYIDAEGNQHEPLELAHDNPVDTVLATVRELDRFLMAKRVIKDLRPVSTAHPEGLGILKFARLDDTGRLVIPKGYREVNDSAFKVYAENPKKIRTDRGLAQPTAKGRPEYRQAGAWVAPETVAQVFNNYLSQGATRSGLYRGARTVANTINQAQLGLSAFHAGFTSVDSAVSRFAMGVEQVVEGLRTAKGGLMVEGARSIVSSPVAPITNAVKGYNLRKALMDPSFAAAHPEMARVAEWVKMAGGRADVDPIYKNNLWQAMHKSFRQNDPLMGFLRLPFALVEKSAEPLMSHFVPWQKLGVFADLARFDLDKLPAGATREQQRTAVQGAWRSVDNRMGQLVYDNLMWNKTAKDLGMLAIRSVGWNLGTVREIMGGAKDWASFFNDLPRSGRRAEFTHRMAYTVALPMVVGSMGAIANKLMTGEAPQSWKDYLAPRTGRKDEFGHDERIWFPSYLKDIYHYSTEPGQTIKGKIHPMFGMVADMLNNEDFYGVEIANHNDPLLARLMEYAGYTAEQFSPLSIRTAATREQGPETPAWQKAASFVGIVPAPAALKKSDAENYASHVLAGRGQKGARSQEEAERRRALQQIKAAMRAGTDATPIIKQYIDSGVIAPGSIRKAGKSVILSTLATDVRQLDLEEAMNTYRRATAAERVELVPILKLKIRNQFRQLKQLPRNKAERLAKEAGEIMKLQVGESQ